MESFIRVVLTLLRGAALLAAFRSHGPARHLCGTAFAALWLYPTLRRNCRWHGPVAQTFETNEKEVWLTIDDGPHPESTPRLLEILAHFQVKASFFVIGSQVDANRVLCRKILEAGHTLENHSHTHPAAWWWALPGVRIRREVIRCQEAILCATGRSAEFFRPPVGMCGPGVHPAAKACGLQVVGWSAAGGDGCPRPPSDVVERLLAQVAPGGILLLHEGDRPRHRALALTRVLEGLRAKGFRCVLPSPDRLR